ncbi:uncharacterized protein TNCV_3878491 [Trichonephila clavipes]|nr:uncharacterized protein TNCV_3878491 [Trichonephila clavipes]
MYTYTLQEALFICYKQSPDNARSVVFSQRANSPRLIEYNTLNECGIINNLIDHADGQEEPDSLRADKIYGEISKFKIMKFKKEIRSRISGYRYIFKQLTKRSSSQKLISYLMVPKNKSIEIVSLSDESDFVLIHYKKMSALDYDEQQ